MRSLYIIRLPASRQSIEQFSPQLHEFEAQNIALFLGDDGQILPVQNALHLFPTPESDWRAQVYTCSSTDGTGLEEIWKGVEDYLEHIQRNGYFERNRNRQNKYWMYESINEALKSSFYLNPEIEKRIGEVEQRVLDAKLSSFIAAKELLDIYFGQK